MGVVCRRAASALIALAIGSVASAEVKPGPIPPWYRPMALNLRSRPQERLSAVPDPMGRRLYGAIRLGDGGDPLFTVIVDRKVRWREFAAAYAMAEGKVEMADVPARIYVDANNDEDLTNDGDGLLMSCRENPQVPGSFTISSPVVRCHVPYADGEGVEYPVALYMFPQRGSGKSGKALGFSRTLLYYRAGSFEVRLPVAGVELLARFYDENADGLIMVDDGDLLALDLDEDGKLEPSMKGPEIYELDRPFHFRGETYALDTYGPRGDDPTCRISEEKVEAPHYIRVGEEAPDFRIATLDGGHFDLAQQQGKVVLIDFWATWCKPCRDELPNVVKLWQEAQDQGLVILGVSMDDDTETAAAEEIVREFAEEQGMTWTHVVEGRGWKSRIGDLYQVTGIPNTVLIGPDRKIIAVGLRGDKLREQVQAALAGAAQAGSG